MRIGYYQKQFGNKVISYFTGTTRFETPVPKNFGLKKEELLRVCRTDKEREDRYKAVLSESINCTGTTKHLIGVQVRRGDWARAGLFSVPVAWYLDWLADIWTEDMLLFVATDGGEDVTDKFSKYNPITSKSLGLTWEAARGFPDLWILSQCNTLAVSQGTFGFLACLMNEKAEKFYRPTLNGDFKEFDPWSAGESPWKDLRSYKTS